jgi:hypothetical protein
MVTLMMLIEVNAQKINALTLDENWMVLRTRAYSAYSKDFQRSVDDITRAAREKNLDGATLGYVRMTLNCVTCHGNVRAQREKK